MTNSRSHSISINLSIVLEVAGRVCFNHQLNVALTNSSTDHVSPSLVGALVYHHLHVANNCSGSSLWVAQVQRHVLQGGPRCAVLAGCYQSVTRQSISQGVNNLLTGASRNFQRDDVQFRMRRLKGCGFRNGSQCPLG